MGWDGEGTGLGWAPHTSNRPKPSSYQQPSLCLVVCPGAQGCCGSAPHTISPNARQLEIERERTLMRQGLAGADLSGDGLLDMGEVSSPGNPFPGSSYLLSQLGSSGRCVTPSWRRVLVWVRVAPLLSDLSAVHLPLLPCFS